MCGNRFFSVAALIVSVVFACPAATASIFEVKIDNFAFIPDTLTVCAGDTVRWTNVDGLVPHTSTSDTGVWDSGTLLNGDEFEFTFTQAGSFPYHCSIHPAMTAVVSVESDCTLAADVETFDASTGGTITFTLDAGAANAGRNFILAGGVTGTVPGTPLPGGLATIPLNRDQFTDIVLDNLNTSTFSNFSGALNGVGTATAQFVRSSLPPVFVGRTMYYAYALRAPFDFASNAVAIEVLP